MARVASALGLGLLATAHAVTVRQPYLIVKDHVIEYTQHDSKPGSTVVQDWRGRAPLFPGGDEWRGQLGQAILGTLQAKPVMGACKQFVSVGNYSYCKHTMPRLGEGGGQSGHPEYEYTLPQAMVQKEAFDRPDNLQALSFGGSMPDTWSEFMGDKYKISTKVEKLCLEGSSGDDTCQPLSAALQDRPPRSTLVKLDVDGAEWGALEWLLGRDDEIRKVRTLDVHFNLAKDARVDEATAQSKETMARHVEVMKALSRKFAVAGSSVEGNLYNVKAELEASPTHKIAQPLIHTQGGLPMEHFVVSYVNWELL